MEVSSTVLALLRNPETPYYAIADALQEDDMTVRSIWLVIGGSGHYSDRRTWIVAAYLGREAAAARCDTLTKFCMDNKCHSSYYNGGSGGYDYDDEEVITAKGRELDPGFTLVYDGVDYVIEEVPLEV